MIVMYAVKHRTKELYLPVVKGTNTKAELTDPMEAQPRLFKSYKGADQARRAWAKGHWKTSGTWEYPDCEYSSGGSYYVIDKMYTIPQRHRHLDDVEVVEVTLSIRELNRG